MLLVGAFEAWFPVTYNQKLLNDPLRNSVKVTVQQMAAPARELLAPRPGPLANDRPGRRAVSPRAARSPWGPGSLWAGGTETEEGWLLLG